MDIFVLCQIVQPKNNWLKTLGSDSSVRPGLFDVLLNQLVFSGSSITSNRPEHWECFVYFDSQANLEIFDALFESVDAVKCRR